MLNPHLVLLITAATAWWTGMSVLALRFPINLTRIRRSSSKTLISYVSAVVLHSTEAQLTVECDEEGANHLSDIYGKIVSDAISVKLYAYLQDMENRLMRRQDLALQQIKKQIEEELLTIKDTSNRKGEDNNLQSFKVKESILR